VKHTKHYMKIIELNNDKLKEMLEAKGALITQGRSISEEIENLEAQMKAVDDELVAAEKLIDISDIDMDAQSITDRFNALKAEMDEVNKKVAERLSKEVPQELKDRYDTMKKMKDDLETERNKIAIKAQKYNDKLIPLTRKLLKPFLEDEFDDFGSVTVENGIIKGVVFNHVDDFKDAYRKKKA